MEIVFTLNQIKKVAEAIIKKIKNDDSKIATVVTLSGELGSGKTTLTQEIARGWGVKENLISPTFVIMKKYQTKNKKHKNLIHIDAYRLTSSEELLKLGWKKLIGDKNNLIVVEWPERVPECFGKNVYRVILGHQDETTRTLKFLV